MRATTFEEALDERLSELRALLIERQRKYGPNNIRALGLAGILSRIEHDKMERLSRVIRRQALRDACLQAGLPRDVVDRYLPEPDGDFADESLRDAILDVAGYAIIMAMVYDGDWGLPLAEE